LQVAGRQLLVALGFCGVCVLLLWQQQKFASGKCGVICEKEAGLLSPF